MAPLAPGSMHGIHRESLALTPVQRTYRLLALHIFALFVACVLLIVCD